MTALGVDYQQLAPLNPRLIYASISGYGQTGPHRNKGGFDLIAQGVAGIMSVTGEPGGRPVKAGVPVAELSAGLFKLVGIFAAGGSRHPPRARPPVGTPTARSRLGPFPWGARPEI